MRFIVILIFSFLFAQELEVDGDLKVTGTIQNDSLMIIIADLQAQIVALQTQLAMMQGASSPISSKIVQLTVNINPYCNNVLNINDAIDEDQTWYRITYMNLKLDNYQGENTTSDYVYIGVGNLGSTNLNDGMSYPYYSAELKFNQDHNTFNAEPQSSQSSDLVMLIYNENPDIGLTCTNWNISSGGTYNGTATLTLLLESDF